VSFLLNIPLEAWHLLLESSVYILFGLLVSGLLRVFLNPASVARHLGRGGYTAVLKAALLGIPIPLCSCGVLPAAVSLKKQGASNGATTAFLISTPESGVDSIAITYALLDPIMTVARPVAAFFSAIIAGISENLFHGKDQGEAPDADLSCPVDGCCDGEQCPPEEHTRHHTFKERVTAGLRYAFTDVWGDLAGWFFVGLILAGLITTVIPEDTMGRYLGGGLPSMLIMLVLATPLYICATASTPIAAALILKGISPGAALVFLLAGPATNVTSLTVLFGILGKRATIIYLSTIAASAVLFGVAVDRIYGFFGVSPQAVVGKAAEVIPHWAEWAGALILVVLSIKPVFRGIIARVAPRISSRQKPASGSKALNASSGCTAPTCNCSSGPAGL
jgi:uncharacterized membrane protein YraQ (UPF0718 family)